MTNDDKLRLIEEMMELEEGALALDTVLEDVEEYDSFFKLYLTAHARKNMDKKLTVAEIENFRTVQDICDYLS